MHKQKKQKILCFLSKQKFLFVCEDVFFLFFFEREILSWYPMTTDPSEVVDMQHSESSSARSRQKDPPVLERSSSNC